MMEQMELQLIPEHRIEGKRLGRHIQWDPRNDEWLWPRTGPALKTISHARVSLILDQGSVGSCTGNAAAGAIDTRPTFVQGRDPILVEADALKIYSLATELDGFPGTYPPDDTGSSGTAAMKAARQLGWISNFRWCRETSVALNAVMLRPICVGVNWYEGFDSPDVNGKVSIAGQVRGGHEFVIRGYDAASQVVWADNSWGTGWGVKGRFCFSVADLNRLLSEGGDCVVPLRLV